MPTLLILADADPTIGVGHAMRMLALGQAWIRSGGRVALRGELPAALAVRMRDEGLSVWRGSAAGAPAREIVELARHIGAPWVALDGYRFSAALTRHLRDAGLCVLQMDDSGHQPEYNADLLVNQNPGAEALTYCMNADARLLRGPRYALLRGEFLRRSRCGRSPAGRGTRVLVTMGGSDPQNATLSVLRALLAAQLKGLEIAALVGPANPHRESLVECAERSGGCVALVEPLCDMAAYLFSRVDAAVSSASSTCFELAYAGIPFVALQTADNQRLMASGLASLDPDLVLPPDAEGAWPRLLGDLLGDADRMRRLADKTSFVDGLGGQRVCDALKGARIVLRRALRSDADDLFRWRNHPTVRRFSRNQDEIGYAEHGAWLDRVLGSPSRHLLIGQIDGGPLGVLRYDEEDAGRSAEISIYLVPEKQGRGWGAALLLAGAHWCRSETGIRRVLAAVLPENVASMKTFARAGFMPCPGGFSLDIS